MSVVKNILNYTISFCVGIFIITYLIKIPYVLTGNTKLVNKYYIENFNTNIIIDYVLVLIYLIIAYFFINILKIKNYIYKIITVIIVTALISSIFCYYFRAVPQTKNFFSIWFNTIGYSAVLYDIILLVGIYLIYLYMDKILHLNF